MKREQLPAEASDWSAEARTIGAVLARMHSGPPPYGTPKAGTNVIRAIATGETLEQWPLRFATAKAIIRLQEAIGWHLSYRLREHHKVRPIKEDRQIGLRFIARLRPEGVMAYIDDLAAHGVRFAGSDAWAVRAYVMLGQVLLNRCVSDEWKQALPLAVASIGGESASRAAIRKAKKPRGIRSNELRDAKFLVRAADPHATWKNILDALETDGPVDSWSPSHVHWTDGHGKARTTKTGTFKNWKPRP